MSDTIKRISLLISRAMRAPDDSWWQPADEKEAAGFIVALAKDITAAIAPMDGSHELLGFLAVYADRYQRDFGLNGLHPTHYDLMEKYGARMVDFTRATNAALPSQERGK